jgi:lipoprotein-releasing system permease protein
MSKLPKSSSGRPVNVSWFIGRRLMSAENPTLSRLVIRVAMIAVALSLAVMIIANSVVTGFQQAISNKIFGFWGHIIIQSIDQTQSYENDPVSVIQPFYKSLDSLKEIRHIQVFATKPGILKTDSDIDGIVLKGIGPDFDWNFLKQFIIDGKPFDASDSNSMNDIIISKTTASRLNLKVDEKVMVYFIQNPMRYRKFKIVGIYNTGVADYDRIYALVNIFQIQALNDWQPDEVGGFEVFIKNVNDIDRLGKQINENYVGQSLSAYTIKEINPNLFDWLNLQTMNERVIMILMILVAVINMTTVLLILILERTGMIGVLKSIGSSNWNIRKIFLYHAAFITIVGLLIGNGVGIGLCLLQQNFHLVKLPEESYYVSEAPVLLNAGYILFLNIGTLLVCVLTLIIPSYFITRVNPVKAIRFK